MLPTGKHITCCILNGLLGHGQEENLKIIKIFKFGNDRKLESVKNILSISKFLVLSESISNLQLDDRRIIAILTILNPLDMSVIVLEKY